MDRMAIKRKRAYDPPAPDDGFRILIDRLWPRGVRREDARVHAWRRELAPSTELRKWFGHDPARWAEFQRRYAAELKSHEDLLRELAARAKKGPVTLVFGAKDTEHNNAVVLEGRIRSLQSR